MTRFLAALMLFLGLAGCRDLERLTGPAPEAAGPNYALSDALHGGRPGFFFLPPLVNAPTYTGSFDAALAPVVRICALAAGTCASEVAELTTTGAGAGTITVDPEGEAYTALWKTKGLGLLPSTDYRLRVFVGALQLGHLDLDVVASAQQLKDVTAEMIGLIRDHPLPIKFRIESGIVARMEISPEFAFILPAHSQQFEATLWDLHDNLVTGPSVLWTSANTDVVTIDATGLATAATTEGVSRITASSQQVSATAVAALLDVPGLVIGYAAQPLTRHGTRESLLGNLVTDAMRFLLPTDFAITIPAQIRADLTCPEVDLPDDFCPAFTPPPFPITRAQVVRALPFGNHAVLVDVTGGELRTIIESGLAQNPLARVPLVSGLCYTYDISAPVGSRVTGARLDAFPGGCTGPVFDFDDESLLYTVALDEFVAGGGGGFPDFSDHRVTVAGLMSRLVMDWVEMVSRDAPYNPTLEGRIVCTSSGATACP